MVKKSSVPLPTRTDLLKILQNIRTSSSPKVQRAIELEEETQEAADDYEESCPRLKQLRKVHDKAYKARRAAENEESGKVAKLRNMILLEGPSARVLKAIKQLVD